MYNLLSLLIGVLIAIMIVCNGDLSSGVGNYSSLVIIHLLGYLALVIIMLCKKIKIPFKMNLPLYLYSAGALGIFTILFNNMAFSVIGVSLPVALGLLGQALASMAFDQYGLLGMKKIKFNKKKIVGIIIIAIGVCIMTFF